MPYTFQTYLTQKYIDNEEWESLVRIISDYNGLFRSWKLIITNDNNLINFYIKTRCQLPPTINKLNPFLLKQVDALNFSKAQIAFPVLPQLGCSFFDLINYCEIKNKGVLTRLEIIFQKRLNQKIKVKIRVYVNKNGIEKCSKVLFAMPIKLLSIDFEGNKRYFYKSAPKYLDISKTLHLLNSDQNSSVLKIDTFPYLQGDFYLNQNSYSFDKHSVIFGASGCGKSKFISLLINNLYKNNNLKHQYRVVIIDPHASLESDVGGIGKVIDFKSDEDSVDLFINKKDDVISSTELLLELFTSLLADQYNSKLERVLRHAIYLLLSDESFNFTNLRKVLLDLEYRNYLIKRLKYDIPMSVINFFLADFNDLKTKSYGEAISPIIAFIDEMEMLPVFNDQKNANNLKEVIADNFLTIFSLDRVKLGDKVTKTVSGLVMQQLLSIIQSKEINEHIIFVVDEVAVVENPILSRFLSEARKYNLSLVLAGQYFSQISESLKNSIFANVINYYIFRVSKIDASILVENFNMKIPLDDSKEKKIKMLTELNNRECVVRIDANGLLLPAIKASTINFESIPRLKKTIFINKNEKIGEKTYKSNFKIDTNVNLKDILIKNSSSRKVIKDE
ncbi:MAG: ATP-binding protein [Bacilli bacterium]|nr:ATP-binding protein [Bacilli bacterium]